MATQKQIIKGIEKVLNSPLSVTEVSKGSGVGKSQISRLRSGFAKITNLNFVTAMALYEFSKKIK